MIRTTSARVAIAVATANGLAVPRWVGDALDGLSAGKADNLGAMVHGLECGQVLAAVDRCPLHVRRWLLLTYGADGYVPLRTRYQVGAALYTQYVETRVARSDPRRLMGAATAVLGDLRQQYRSQARRPATPAEYAEAIGVPVEQYRDYQPAVAAMVRIVDGWDGQGLARVARALPAALEAAG